METVNRTLPTDKKEIHLRELLGTRTLAMEVDGWPATFNVRS